MQADRRPGAALLVGAHQRREVEVGEDVAVEGEEAVLEAVAERVGGEADRPGGAERLGLGDVGDLHPGPLLLVAQRLAQDVGQEAAGEHDLGHPVGGEPLDRVGEEGAVDQRHRRLRHVAGQRPQARSLAADQDNRLHS